MACFDILIYEVLDFSPLVDLYCIRDVCKEVEQHYDQRLGTFIEAGKFDEIIDIACAYDDLSLLRRIGYGFGDPVLEKKMGCFWKWVHILEKAAFSRAWNILRTYPSPYDTSPIYGKIYRSSLENKDKIALIEEILGLNHRSLNRIRDDPLQMIVDSRLQDHLEVDDLIPKAWYPHQVINCYLAFLGYPMLSSGFFLLPLKDEDNASYRERCVQEMWDEWDYVGDTPHDYEIALRSFFINGYFEKIRHLVEKNLK